MALRPAIASVSLGRSGGGHSLPEKIKQAAKHSFEGIEIFFECLEFQAREFGGGLTNESLLLAAQKTREACDEHGLEVICLQPFTPCEGLTSDGAREEMLERLHFWFKLAKILRSDLIQVPANTLASGTTGDFQTIKKDLETIAQLGLQEEPVIRFAYEGIAWGTHIDTWEGTWDVINAVNLPNLGLCLDTFHIAGRIWGDPTVPSGKLEDGSINLAKSLQRVESELDASKIFYLQSGDAAKIDPPLSTSHAWYDPEQRPRMTWSRNARLFAYEQERGGYLPIDEVLEVVIKRGGYRGWVSMETFNRELYNQDPTIPETYAQRGQESWAKMIQSLGIPKGEMGKQ